MAIVEAEILGAQKDGPAVVVDVVYRVNGVEHTRTSLRFNSLRGDDIRAVAALITHEGLPIKNSLEAEIEVKRLVGTKIVIENPPPDVPVPTDVIVPV